MRGFRSPQNDQRPGPSLSPSWVKQEGLNNVSVLLLNEAINLKRKLSGLSLLEYAQSRTNSHGNATSVLRVSGASGQLAPQAGLNGSCLSTRKILYTQVTSHRHGHPPERPGMRSFHPDLPSIHLTYSLPAGIQSRNCVQTLAA